MTRLLALDLGTACGWAMSHYEPTDLPGIEAFRPKHGTFDLRAGQHAGGGMRYLKFRRELDNLKGLVDEVTYEIVRRHVGTAAAHVYGGLLAVLTSWCEENEIPYEGETVQAIKKFACGRGNATKEEMIAAAIAAGFKPANDNEADALHLLRLRLAGRG
jgi:crossover junction endodeoxyribonuclease RuvC